MNGDGTAFAQGGAGPQPLAQLDDESDEPCRGRFRLGIAAWPIRPIHPVETLTTRALNPVKHRADCFVETLCSCPKAETAADASDDGSAQVSTRFFPMVTTLAI